MVLGNEMGPRSLTQTIVASIMFIFGALILAFIFGAIAAAMSGANSRDSKASERVDFMQNTMAAIKLPIPYQNEVHKYIQQMDLAPTVQPDMDKFLKLLSPALTESVL